MTDITPETLARMLRDVTPGPWQADSAFCYKNHALRVAMPDRLGVPSATIAECAENWHEAKEYGEPRISWKEAEANAHFIAWAREAVPALSARLAEVEAGASRSLFALMTERALAAEAENAKLREALTKIEALDDSAECCGQGVSDGYGPPECCCQPLGGLDRAKIIARAALEETKK